MQPKALVLAGAGINCERESAELFAHVGFDVEIMHIIDLLDAPHKLDSAQMLFFPGGFSYGDHGGAAMVLAEQIRRLESALRKFILRETLVMGVCNGCQLLLRLNMLAESQWRFRNNAGGHYECRWVHIKAKSDTPYFSEGDLISLPVAHGEGQLLGGNESEIGLQYADQQGALANGRYPLNPNGAQFDAAAISAHDGRVLAMMPHPERGAFQWQRQDTSYLRELAKRSHEEFDPSALTSAGQIFMNARNWF